MNIKRILNQDTSITQKQTPYENAITKKINGILKQEFDIENRI